jgi:hypothetical protein
MMDGTDKQVKYANDIKKSLMVAITDMKESINADIWKKEETKIKHTNRIEELESKIEAIEDASVLINEYKQYLEMNTTQRIWELGKSASINAMLLQEASKKYAE